MNNENARVVSTLAKAIHAVCKPTMARNAAATAIMAMMGTAVCAQDVEEISITGSRIVRPGLISQTPVTSVSQEELQILAPTTLMDALDQIPQFLASATLDDTSNFTGGGYLGSGGQSNLNLRGVGGNRTLVLLDGRRIVPSNRSGTVDISLFPSALIKRTEVVTGGASAAYGSDAVTGVSNFIMNNEFKGFEANVQYGVSELSDAKNYKVSLAGGVAIGEHGDLVVGLEGYRSDEITDMSNRDWYKSWGDLDFGTTATPRRVRYENVTTRAESWGGLIRRGPLAGTTFLANGTAAPFQAGTVLDASAVTGLKTSVIQGVQVGGSTNQFDRVSMQRAALDRSSLYANYQYKFNDRLTGSIQALVGRSVADNQKIGYVLSGTWPVTIYSGNPYLPADVQAKMTAGKIASFQMDKRVVPADPLDNARAPLTTKVKSVSGSLAGKFSNGWNWNYYYQYGENNRDVELFGYRVDRLFKGVDAVTDPKTGSIICASTLIQPNDGCVPVNLFGIGNTSQAAINWVHDSMFIDAEYTQHSSEFVVNGEVFDGIGAGPVFMAAGANWRRDHADQLSGDAFGAPLPPAGSGYITDKDASGKLLYRGLPSVYLASVPVVDRVNAASYSGTISVWEAFTEANMPLLREKSFAKRFDANLAARYTKYSTINPVWAWKGGLDWEINEQLRLRLTRSRDIRAGNMTELYDTTAVNAFITDPWRPTDDIYIAKSLNGGNPNIKPETADTITYGFVYQPNWLTGSAFSVDYYDIKIADAISSLGVTNIVTFCHDSKIFCDLISYEPSGRISAVNNTTINVGQARTSGIDYEASYRTSVNWFGRNDKLSLRLIASRLISSTISPFASPTVEQVDVGDRQSVHVSMTGTYIAGPVTASLSTRWVSSAVRNRTWVTGVDVDNNDIPSHTLSNLRLSYNLEKLGSGSASVYLAVNNIFDKNPGDLKGLPGIYDVVGRNYNVGINYRY